jgi:hypothetical protein
MALELVNRLPYDHPYRWDGTAVGGVKLWRPDELGADLTLWLDAEDASTITLNGSNVSQWSDKSASAAHGAQATAASQPLYTASGLNGKPVVTFSGAQRLNSVVTSLLGNTVAAISQRSASTQPVFEVSPTSSRGYQGNAIGFQSHNAYYANGGTVTTTVFPTAINSVPAISVATDRRTATAISHAIGHGTPGFVPLTGFISEIVSTETILSTANRQKLEGYLAWKWGLVANLPADHPYKLTPPTA